jgi:hypothetical protein
MSINGSEVLSGVDSALNKARDVARSDANVLSSLHSEHTQAVGQLREAYEALVDARAGDPDRSRAALAEVDTWLAKASQNRAGNQKGLLARLDAAIGQADLLDHECAANKIARDSAQVAWNTARTDMAKQLLASDPSFAAACARQSDAQRHGLAVVERVDEISKAADEFEAQCKADPMFIYCDSRSVGRNGKAKGNAFVRLLDRWVAGTAGYFQHRTLLDRAREDQAQWTAHKALLQQELNQANKGVESAIDQALATDAGQALAKNRDETAKAFNKSADEREQAKLLVEQLRTQKQAFEQHQDPEALEMRNRLSRAIEGASDQALLKAAGETADDKDDVAAGNVSKLRRLIPQLLEKIAAGEESAKDSSSQVNRLETLRNSFRSRGYDGGYSRFDSGFDTNALIMGVMLGRMSANQAIGQCESSHRDVTPPPPPPVHHDSDSSSGGFSSGGSFGAVADFIRAGASDQPHSVSPSWQQPLKNHCAHHREIMGAFLCKAGRDTAYRYSNLMAP